MTVTMGPNRSEIQSSHPEECQWQWLERQEKEFRFYATEVQSLESTHFLLIWPNTVDSTKKHCLCLLICVSTDLANCCLKVFWSMKNYQTLQLETSRQKLEHLCYSLQSMLQICCHLPLIKCPPPHLLLSSLAKGIDIYQKAAAKILAIWQFGAACPCLFIPVTVIFENNLLSTMKKRIGRWFLFKLPFFPWVLRNWTLEVWLYQPWVTLPWRYYLIPWQPVLCQVAIIAVHAST